MVLSLDNGIYVINPSCIVFMEHYKCIVDTNLNNISNFSVIDRNDIIERYNPIENPKKKFIHCVTIHLNNDEEITFKDDDGKVYEKIKNIMGGKNINNEIKKDTENEIKNNILKLYLEGLEIDEIEKTLNINNIEEIINSIKNNKNDTIRLFNKGLKVNEIENMLKIKEKDIKEMLVVRLSEKGWSYDKIGETLNMERLVQV